jgi:predicted acetyltransferase/nitroreductase
MEFFDTVRARHSYRGKYADTKIPREHLTQIMQAGLDAPSGCNKQTVSLIGVDDPALLQRLLAVMNPPTCADVPALICVLTKKRIAYRDGCGVNRVYNVQDYSAAIENMLLAITALGYASCWIEGHITDADRQGDKMAEILGVPAEYRLICVLPVGVPAEEAKCPCKRDFSQRAWFNGFDPAASGLRLERPDAAHAEAAMQFRQEFFDCGETVINGSELLDRTECYADWLRSVTDNTSPETVSPDWVVTDTFFAVSESGRIVGIIDFRHALNDWLRDFGHVGFSVRPSERRRGYATKMLGQILRIAREAGLRELMLSAERENMPSVKTIVTCGGEYVRSFTHEGAEADVYRIIL